MDARGPILLAFAAFIAISTWRADRSGEVTLKWSLLYRKDRPRFFRVMIVVQWVLAAAIAGLGVAALFGWDPIPLDFPHPETCRTC